ncbi:hypothetical protein C8J56DRAFT_888283 [Mycena floridula]|nr:hypothetical protein C8J56DRAFT_888283 [Mycena floridula]
MINQLMWLLCSCDNRAPDEILKGLLQQIPNHTLTLFKHPEFQGSRKNQIGQSTLNEGFAQSAGYCFIGLSGYDFNVFLQGYCFKVLSGYDFNGLQSYRFDGFDIKQPGKLKL